MPFLTYLDPLSTNICISSALDQKRLSYRLEKNVQWRKRSNKMTECILNALAFLFLIIKKQNELKKIDVRPPKIAGC